MEKQQAVKLVQEKKDQWICASDRIWNYAEMAFCEHQSAALLCELLEQEGFAVERGVAGIPTAFTGTYGSGYPVIGFLGEYDALSGMNQKAGSCTEEPTSAEMKGQPGHGCGHNLLGVGALAAAVAVKEYLKNNPQVSGTVIYFGCPGEEGGSGKAFMAREGLFDGLDAALTWHPDSANYVRSGSTLANYQVEYAFKGVASHAGVSPHRGRSALDAVELMNVGVQFLREHMQEKERIHYAITDTGGRSPNVVQADAKVLYLIRSTTNNMLEDLYRRVNLIAKGAAMMTETEVSIRFIKGCSNVVSNTVLEELTHKNLAKADLPRYTEEELAMCKTMFEAHYAGKKDPREEPGKPGFSAYRQMRANSNPYINDFVLPYEAHETPSTGSTDVGDVSWNCPTVELRTVTEAVGTTAHSWQRTAFGAVGIGHKGMLLAGEVLAATAIDLLNDPAILDKAKAELQQRLEGGTYKCPIPKGVMPTVMSK